MIAYFHKIYVKHREIISYIFFGALTTAVNFAVYYPLYNFWHVSPVFSNMIAWLAAVIFAFFVNKRFVFRNTDWSLRGIIKQGIGFAGCRIASGAAETVLLYITVDLLLFDGNLWKLIVSVVVIILNYLGSKLLVFRKTK